MAEDGIIGMNGMTVRTIIMMGGLLALSTFVGIAAAAPRSDNAEIREWTIKDTVSSAINYAPSIKREREGVRMAKENVRQAQAGHLPRVDVQAKAGASTLQVSKYE